MDLKRGDCVRIAPDAVEAETKAFPSGNIQIDALLFGYEWPSYVKDITYSFYDMGVFGGAYYGPQKNVKGVSDGIQKNVREIISAFTIVFNLNFKEIKESLTEVGMIRIMGGSDAAYAYAYVPSSVTPFHVAGDIHLNSQWDHNTDVNGFQGPQGTHGYTALIHELGHTLGLKHPHSGTPVMPKELDTDKNTVMSYNFSSPSPATFRPFDELALTWLYGVPVKTSILRPPTQVKVF